MKQSTRHKQIVNYYTNTPTWLTVSYHPPTLPASQDINQQNWTSRLFRFWQHALKIALQQECEWGVEHFLPSRPESWQAIEAHHKRTNFARVLLAKSHVASRKDCPLYLQYDHCQSSIAPCQSRRGVASALMRRLRTCNQQIMYDQTVE